MMIELSPSVLSLLNTLITAVVGLVAAWIAMKQSMIVNEQLKQSARLEENTAITKLTHESTNSKMDVLLKEVAASAEAKGKLAEQEAQRRKDAQDAHDSAHVPINRS